MRNEQTEGWKEAWKNAIQTSYSINGTDEGKSKLVHPTDTNEILLVPQPTFPAANTNPSIANDAPAQTMHAS